MKGYRWCTAHMTGHPLDGPVCDLWQSAMRENEVRNERRHEAWQRSVNRGRRYRRCLFCRRIFDAGSTRGSGRPRETCSQTCSSGREVERRKLSRHGLLRPASTKRRRKRRSHEWNDRVQLRTNGYNGHRISDELRDFLDAFPDGGWTVD